MASGGKSDPFELELPLEVTISAGNKPLSSESLKDLQTHLEGCLKELQLFVEKTNKIEFVHLSKVTLKKDTLCLCSHLLNADEVDEIWTFVNKKIGRKKKTTLFSKTLADFFEKKGFHRNLLLRPDERLAVKSIMTKKQRAKADMYFEEDSDENKKPEQQKNKLCEKHGSTETPPVLKDDSTRNTGKENKGGEHHAPDSITSPIPTEESKEKNPTNTGQNSPGSSSSNIASSRVKGSNTTQNTGKENKGGEHHVPDSIKSPIQKEEGKKQEKKPTHTGQNIPGSSSSNTASSRVKGSDTTQNQKRNTIDTGGNIPGSSSSNIASSRVRASDTYQNQERNTTDTGRNIPGSSSSNTASSRVQASDTSQFVKKELLLYIPKSYTTIKVYIRCNCLQKLDGIEMHCQGDLWRASIEVPVNAILGKLVISFEFRYRWMLSTYWENTYSPLIDLNDSYQTVRTVYGEWNVAAIDSHIQYLFRSSTTDFKECAMEIEVFISKLTFSDALRTEVVRHISNYQANGDSNVHMLQVITIGSVYWNYGIPNEIPVKKCIAIGWAHTLSTKWLLADLPSSCSKYIPPLCEYLFKCELGSEACFIAFIWKFERFLGTECFLTQLKETRQNRPKQMPVLCNSHSCYDTCLEVCNGLLAKALEIGGSASKNSSTELLTAIIQELPFQMVCMVMESLKKSPKSQSDGFSAVIERIRCFATTAFKRYGVNYTKTLKECVYFLESVQGYKEFSSESQFLVDLLVSCLKKTPCRETVCPALTELCKTHWFLAQTKHRKVILSTLASSLNKSMHIVFMNLAKDDAFCKEQDVVDDDHLCLLLDTILKQNSESVYMLPKLYSKLCDIWNLPAIETRKETEEKLENAVVKYLRRLNIKDVLRQAGEIGKVALDNKLAGKLFGQHCSSLIKERFGQKPEEALFLLSHGRNTLDIDYSLNAELVNTIINCIDVGSAENTITVLLNRIYQNGQFWKLVLSARGRYAAQIEKNPKVKLVRLTADTFVDLLEMGEFKCDDLVTLGKSIDLVKCMNIICIDRERRQTLEKLWHKCVRQIDSLVEDSRIVSDVMTRLKASVSSNVIPFQQQTEIEILVCEVKQTVTDLDIPLSALQSLITRFESISEITKHCKTLETFVASRMFFNSCVDLFEEHEDDEFIGLANVRQLFYTQPYEEYASFLQQMASHGIDSYTKAWRSLQFDEKLSLETVMALLENVNIQEEMPQAKHRHISIERDTEDALSRLFQTESYRTKVDAMVKGLHAFNLEIQDDSRFMNAVTSFKHVLENDDEHLLFRDVKASLKSICDVADSLSDEVISVIGAVGESSLLIEFFRDLVDEDVRNLIDAVEEVSEQQVQESTVSGFIEVKRFMQPLLTASFVGPEKEKEFLSIVAEQTEKFQKGIPQKITDCNQNLHNLKSLYNNLANRSEMTKTQIENVLRCGKFAFQIQIDQCEFSVQYIHENKKVSHAKSTLTDIRSRALLLMNADTTHEEKRMKTEDLELFVEYVDVCTDIERTVSELHAHGHRDYKGFNVEVSPGELNDLKFTVSQKLKEWLDDLHQCRRINYFLNFVYGDQLLKLYDCFKQGTHTDDVAHMLKFINPHSQMCFPAELFSSCIPPENESQNEFLEFLGKILQEHISNLKPFHRKSEIEYLSNTSLRSFVQPGRLFVAELQKDSSLVINAIISLYHLTVNTLPEANQLLLCSFSTPWTEIELILQRCVDSYSYYERRYLYCIVNVELLPSELQFKLVAELREIEQRQDYLLAIICRGSFLNELSEFKSAVAFLAEGTLQGVLKSVCPDAITITSSVAGLGKTSHVHALGRSRKKKVCTIHISGCVNKKALVQKLKLLKLHTDHILHIDIGNVENTEELDAFAFELLVLRYVSYGTTTVHVPTGHVYIEIANTIADSLLKSLHTVTSFRRINLQWQKYDDFIISSDINSQVQVVCHYLKCFDMKELDKRDLHFVGANAVQPLSRTTCLQLLMRHFPSTSETSFTIVHVFLNFFSDQLKKLSCSSFFRTRTLTEMLGSKNTHNIKKTLVGELLQISVDFASRSVSTCRSTQASTLVAYGNDSKTGSPSIGELAAESVKGMIRWEDSNHLMFVFHNQDIQTVSVVYRNVKEIAIKRPQVKTLFEGQMGRKEGLQDYEKMDQEELQKRLQHVARTNPVSLERKILQELAREYALTPDNFLKMILIMLRVKAGIPVIVMGETGCGKTSLIRYLSRICGVSFKVLSIHAGVTESEIVQCVKEINGTALEDFGTQVWLFLDEINTCNHLGLISDIICHRNCHGKQLSPNLVVMAACNPYKLRSEKCIFTSGLQEKVKTDELSRLVYRVHPLPESMVDYVWDFGALSDEDEASYVTQMSLESFETDDNRQLFSQLLQISQQFVRRNEGTSCSVSLRDVRRCCKLARWFQDVLSKKGLIKRSHEVTISPPVLAMVLALAHCYQSRFSDTGIRKEYRCQIASGLKMCNDVDHYTETEIIQIIQTEQNDILDRMDLPPGTAQNVALQENVFVILTCILNRIPIFLVGKPGCSKSLSMQIIRSNLRGKDSKDEFFKTLPQLYCVSFQGSESSTSDGIQKVFEKAENYQKSNSAEDVLSVVILDEIGLAEVSRFNPLKVLHSLLEPEEGQVPNVAVVGISNWSLDASKMNRAVHLSRPEMDVEELFATGKSISESFVESVTKADCHGTAMTRRIHGPTLDYDQLTDEQLKAVADSYSSYIQHQQTFKHFHGLRDFYALIKFVAKRIVEKKGRISQEKKKSLILQGLLRNFGGIPNEIKILLDAFKLSFEEGMPVLSLIKENITDLEARHLMLITTGDAILSVLDDTLFTLGRDKTVIFGSRFKEDLTDDYSYRILSRIILCMEQGMVLILKDLENIYGSLYDMLNQNYTMIGKKKNCRIALGQYSNPICHVHDEFRCIVLVQENNLQFSDPPFLNRFEKQFLTFNDILSKNQLSIIGNLTDWMDSLTDVPGKHFQWTDIIPICSEDLLPSLVMRVSKGAEPMETAEIFETCKNELLWIIQPEAIVRLQRSELNFLEVQMIQETYFNLPIHKGLKELLDTNMSPLTMVFTNSNVHTMLDIPKESVQTEHIGAFKSEKQFHIRLKHFWKESDTTVLILHCSAVDDGKHILLAKTSIEKLRKEFLKLNLEKEKQAVLIIHLERSDSGLSQIPQVNFLSDWKLVTIDTLKSPVTPLPEISRSLNEAIHQRKPFYNCIREHVFWALTRIHYPNAGRSVEDFSKVLEQMQNSTEFLDTMQMLIDRMISDDAHISSHNDWQEIVACDTHALLTSSSLTGALEGHIVERIKGPLAIIFFQLERCTALDTFFMCTESKDKLDVWLSMTDDTTIFDVSDIRQPKGPECYVCPYPALKLKMPFSMVFYSRVESTKDEFMSVLNDMMGQRNAQSVDELSEQDTLDLTLRHQFSVSKIVEPLNSYSYDSWQLDYFADFCNLVSSSVAVDMPEDRRVEAIQWAISTQFTMQNTEPKEFFSYLHTTYWMNSNMFESILMLLGTCKEFIKGGIELFLQTNCRTRDDESSSQVGDGDDSVTRPEQEAAGTANVPNEESDASSSNPGENSPSESETAGRISPDGIATIVGTLSNNEDQITNITDIHFSFAEAQESESKDPSDDYDCANRTLELTVGASSSDVDSLEISGQGQLSVNDLLIDNHEQEDNEDVTGPITSAEDEEGQVSISGIEENHAIPYRVEAQEPLQNTPRSNPFRYSLDSDTNVHFYTDIGEDKLERHYGIEDLVNAVCLSMLPTKETVSLEGIENWHFKANKVLALASLVSIDSGPLHSLRFCNDVVSLSHDMEVARIVVIQLGCILKRYNGNRLDSSEVFNCIQQHVEQGHVDDSLRIWSLYFKRCSGANASSPALSFLLQLFSERQFVGQDVQVFRIPIEEALQSERDDDVDTYWTTLDVQQDDTIASQFIMDLDTLFKQFYSGKEHIGPLVVLVVDVLESLFMENITKQYIFTQEQNRAITCLFSAEEILRESTLSFRHAVGIAYIRAFFTLFVQHLPSSGIDGLEQKTCMVTYQAIKAVLDESREDVNHVMLRDFFFKVLIGDRRVSYILSNQCELERCADFLKGFSLVNEYTLNGFQYAPLISMCPELDKLVKVISAGGDIAQTKIEITKMVEKASMTPAGMADLFAFTQYVFYMHRTVETLDDTYNTLGQIILNEAIDKKLPATCLKFLGCLSGCGNEQFQVERLNINTETDQTDITIAAFITSLVSSTLTNNQTSGLTVFGHVLYGHSRDIEGSVPYRSRDDKELMSLRVKKRLCCSLVYIQLSNNEICPNCKKTAKIEEVEHRLAQPQRNTIVDSVFELFKLGLRIGSISLGLDVKSEIDSCGVEGKEVKDAYLYNKLLSTWLEVGNKLGFRDSRLGLLLHIILKSVSCHTTFPKSEKMHVSEKAFKETVEGIIADRFRVMETFATDHCKLYPDFAKSKEMELLELPTIDLNAVRQLFRFRGTPSVEQLISEMQMCKSEKLFPFLHLVMSEKQRLELLKYAYPLIRWHQAAVSNANYLLRRDECTRRTVAHLIGKCGDENKKTNLRIRFNELTDALDNLKKCSEVSMDNLEIPNFSLESTLSDCLMLEETSPLWKVFSYLVRVQNTFIEKSMAMAIVGSCNNLFFLRDSKCMAVASFVTVLTKDSFIDFTWHTENVFDFAHASLQFGKGRQILYDFGTMEKVFGYRILLNKPLVNINGAIQRLVFKDEMYKRYAKIVGEVKAMIPQVSIPMEVTNHLNNKKTTDPEDVHELLNQLDAVISLLVKTGAKESDSLLEFVDKWSTFFTRPFPRDALPSPENSVRLCHIVSLHELLEEINAEGMISGLEDRFRVEVPGDIRDSLGEICSQSARFTDCLLQSVKRFIHRCMTQEDMEEKQKLFHYLHDPTFWTDGLIKEGKITTGTSFHKPIAEVIPQLLLLEHTFRLVKYLEETVKDQKKKDLRIGVLPTRSSQRSGKQVTQSRRKRQHII